MADQEIPISIFPNPFENVATLEFESKNEDVKVSVFDAIGSEIRVLANRKFAEGKHRIKFEAHELPQGSYFFRIQTEKGQKTKRIVKIR